MEFLRRLSLRARLVLGVIVLAAVGLGAANAATYTSLRSFLLDRVDDSLVDLARAVEGPLDHGDCPGGRDRRPFFGGDVGDYIEVRAPDGAQLCEPAQVTRFSEPAPAPPELPPTIDVTQGGEGPYDAHYFNASNPDGDRYRVRASQVDDVNAVLVVATTLADVDATLDRLLLIMLLVTIGVLIALTALGLWVVRLGLRPLTDIEATAAGIAAGDLSRRVERAEPDTEVGRLGIALNTMLGQIESSFRAQEASERRLRRFVADASHELRTPLAAVRAYAELFTRGAARRPADLERSMTGITRESERMSLLVEDLLLLARLDEGRPLERELVQLDEVVSEAVETARTVEPERPIETSIEPAVVLGDRDRLRQIVDNLLSNVRNHTPPETPVTVRLDSPNGAAVIAVEDEGPGLSPEEAERVFERFYRADESRSRASGGVGLGLAIVAAVAQAHGGDVAAESDPGRRTSFTITLPLATTKGDEE
jgi:two-component system, OmpR family, sensor kinase